MEQYLLERGLRIKVLSSKGRCLFAGRAFRAGELILRQDPYSSVLDADSKTRFCDSCFRSSSNLKRCSACKNVSYCCQNCQRKEWKFHQPECQIMVKINQAKQKLPPPSIQLIVRLLIKRKIQSSEVIIKTPVDNFEIVEALPTHFSETQEERLVLYAQMSNLVKTVLAPLEVDLKETCELFCRIACNAHTICDEEFRPVGTGLYPVVSIVNHSCEPNAVLHFDGKTASVRALQDIEEGSEVTVSYVELAGSTSTRQKALREQYYFICQCQRCIKSETIEGMVEDSIIEGYKCPNKQCSGALPLDKDRGSFCCVFCGSSQERDKLKLLELAANKLVDQANTASSSGDDARARLLLEQGEAKQKEFFHKYSVHIMRTRDALLKICMSLKDWQSALNYCHLTLPAYERSYSSKSPLVGLQYYTLGKLQWFLGNTTEAVEALVRAREVLSITHGTSSELVQELFSLIQEANMEAAYKGGKMI